MANIGCTKCFLLKLVQRILKVPLYQRSSCTRPDKVEKILKGSLDSILSPSPSVKIQIIVGKICLRCKGETLLGVVNKLFVFKSLLTTPSNVLPLPVSVYLRVSRISAI